MRPTLYSALPSMTDRDELADLIRSILIRRLNKPDGREFALICLDALVKDGKLADLLFVERT